MAGRYPNEGRADGDDLGEADDAEAHPGQRDLRPARPEQGGGGGGRADRRDRPCRSERGRAEAPPQAVGTPAHQHAAAVGGALRGGREAHDVPLHRGPAEEYRGGVRPHALRGGRAGEGAPDPHQHVPDVRRKGVQIHPHLRVLPRLHVRPRADGGLDVREAVVDPAAVRRLRGLLHQRDRPQGDLPPRRAKALVRRQGDGPGPLPEAAARGLRALQPRDGREDPLRPGPDALAGARAAGRAPVRARGQARGGLHGAAGGPLQARAPAGHGRRQLGGLPGGRLRGVQAEVAGDAYADRGLYAGGDAAGSHSPDPPGSASLQRLRAPAARGVRAGRDKTHPRRGTAGRARRLRAGARPDARAAGPVGMSRPAGDWRRQPGSTTLQGQPTHELRISHARTHTAACGRLRCRPEFQGHFPRSTRHPSR
mmetsp:Transcript_37141/g.104795  ORF Transcript_37141/g.104795 Transcript_37141/m.104795 type:complete len:425 (+) Transcript_37141:684-1958(+)